MKTILLLETFSSVFNDQYVNQLAKDSIFPKKYNVIICNLEKICDEFEEQYYKKKYNSLNKYHKILYYHKLNKYLCNRFKQYKGSTIHIQFVSKRYIMLLPFINYISNKRIVSFWGSDLFRQNIIVFNIFKFVFKYVDAITIATTEMKEILCTKIGTEFGRKIHIIKFGSMIYDYIDNITDKDLYEFKIKYKIPTDSRTIVAIGYNRCKEQQHIEVIDSIINSNVDSNSIIIIFPWTYGENDQNYYRTIIDRLNNKYKYVFLHQFMNEKEVACLRIITDILVQVQISDAMSASMLETLYARNEVITGGWLPYKELKDRGLNYTIIHDVEDCGKSISDLLKHPIANDVRNRNREIIYNIGSWRMNIKKWIALYDAVSIK